MPRCPFKFKQFLSSALLHLPPHPPNSSVPRWLTFVSSSSYFDLYFLTVPSLILSSLFFHLLSICIFFYYALFDLSSSSSFSSIYYYEHLPVFSISGEFSDVKPDALRFGLSRRRQCLDPTANVQIWLWRSRFGSYKFGDHRDWDLPCLLFAIFPRCGLSNCRTRCLLS